MCSKCGKTWLLSIAIKVGVKFLESELMLVPCLLACQGKSSLALRFCQGRFNPYHEDGMWNLTVSTPNRRNWSTFDIFWHIMSVVKELWMNYLDSNFFCLCWGGWKFSKWRNLTEKFSTVDYSYCAFPEPKKCHIRWIGYHWCCLLAADCAITQLGWNLLQITSSVWKPGFSSFCRICAGDGGQLKLHVWDTGGQDSEGLNMIEPNKPLSAYLGSP